MRLELDTGVYEIDEPLFADFEVSGREIGLARPGVISNWLQSRAPVLIEEYKAREGGEIVYLGYEVSPEFWTIGRTQIAEGRWVFAKPDKYRKIEWRELRAEASSQP